MFNVKEYTRKKIFFFRINTFDKKEPYIKNTNIDIRLWINNIKKWSIEKDINVYIYETLYMKDVA